MFNLILETAEFACDIHKKEKTFEVKQSVKDEVDAYITLHYSEVELNVSHIGDVFGVTPTYLSRLYKKEVGFSILQAINIVRIDASKQLLLETDMTINEIATEVVYLYCNAFMRFFKKQTGVTPGQYKEMNRIN